MDDSIVGVCIECKLFTVCFTRGSGKCRDEAIYVVSDTDIENVKKRVQEYFTKHFANKGWLVGIYIAESDEDGFYCITEHYS